MSLSNPPSGIVAITPHDVNYLPKAIRGFIVAGSGDVQVGMEDGTSEPWPALAGVEYSARINRIYATGTTATGILGLY